MKGELERYLLGIKKDLHVGEGRESLLSTRYRSKEVSPDTSSWIPPDTSR